MKRQRAQNLVEFGLIAPVFFLLVLGLLDIGRGVWYYNTAASIARDLARQREFVTTGSKDLTNCKQMFMVSACTPANGVTIQDLCPKIEVDYQFQPALSMFFNGGSGMTITATSYVPSITGSGFCP
jgi:Flp pilus assembly protein TadG